MIDDKTLLAYADGELQPDRAAAVERMLATDLALAAKLERHRRLTARLQTAYNPVLTEPIPESMARSAAGGQAVISLADARAERAAKTASRGAWRTRALLAASLVGAVAVGQAVWTSHTSPVAMEGGQLVATGQIRRSLDTQLSGGDGAIRIMITYRDQAGAICRSFTGASSSGVACRERGRWALKALLPGSGPTGEYRMAAGGDPRIMRIVEETISGQPFDAAQERAAKAGSWSATSRDGRSDRN